MRRMRGDGMDCYRCGYELTEHEYCPHCGADVSVYKRILRISNYFYNEGLAKAGVRDLSGAIVSLRQSVRFNKENIDARNLLGLVYYETGEVVAALSEWVISKNLKPEQNLADDYINRVQSSQTRLETINQTIRKYNQALAYCRQGSLDLAVIQLKKVLSLNGRFVRAHQLLALLYMQSGDWAKAKKELTKCMAIDRGSTMTLRYLKEVDSRLLPEEGQSIGIRKKQAAPDVVQYRSGNETIIQPAGAKNPGIDAPALPSNLINIGLGLLIGAAVVGFLVMPARVQAVRQSSADELRVVSEQSDAKTATIQEREQQIEELTQGQEELRAELEQYKSSKGQVSASDALFEAASAYLKSPDDIAEISKSFSAIDYEAVEQSASEQFKSLYGTLYEKIRPQLRQQYYDTGYQAYQDEDYVTAIDNLQKAVQYGQKEDGSDYAEAVFYLADSYYSQYKNAANDQKSKFAGNIAKAQQGYTEVSTDFPELRIANTADAKLEEIRNLRIDPVTETDGNDGGADGTNADSGTSNNTAGTNANAGTSNDAAGTNAGAGTGNGTAGTNAGSGTSGNADRGNTRAAN